MRRLSPRWERARFVGCWLMFAAFGALVWVFAVYGFIAWITF